MPGPFRKTLSVVDKSYLPGSGKNKILSIGLSPDGFSFAILDPRTSRYIMLESYDYMPDYPTAGFPEQFEAFIRNYPLLLSSFERINLSWFQPQFILIPAPLLLHSGCEAYLHYTGEMPRGHELKTDKLNKLDAYGLYPFPANLKKQLEFLYPSHRLRHPATVLIEALLTELRQDHLETDLVLYIYKTHFQILLFQKNKLVFYNSFAYKTFDDLRYFLFYVMEEFQLQANKTTALFAGDIFINSEEHKQLSQYFKETGFLNSSKIYKFGQEFDDFPHHAFFNLIHLNACG